MVPKLADGRPLSVLIVDDYADAAESLAELLRVCGHEATVAASGKAALAGVGWIVPDVVILELRLPDLDGCDVARQIRLLSAGPPPLFIAVTTCGRLEDRLRSHAAGIHVHLLKPAEPNLLIDMLARLCDGGLYWSQKSRGAPPVHLAKRPRYAPNDRLAIACHAN